MVSASATSRPRRAMFLRFSRAELCPSIAPLLVQIVAERRQIGRPIDDFDAQIAAITRARGMALATRNGFEGTGVQVIDPWTA